MATAKKTGKDGIDRWTSNGYGITVKKDDNNNKKENKRDLNEEFRNYVNGKE